MSWAQYTVYTLNIAIQCLHGDAVDVHGMQLMLQTLETLENLISSNFHTAGENFARSCLLIPRYNFLVLLIALLSTNSQECSGSCFHHGCPLCCPKLVSLAFFGFCFPSCSPEWVKGPASLLSSSLRRIFSRCFFLFDRNHLINDISKKGKQDQDFVKSFLGHPCACLDCLNCAIQASRPVYAQKNARLNRMFRKQIWEWMSFMQR